MDKLLRFDEMITPKIITIVYWFALLGAVIGGLVSMFGGWGGFTVQKFLFGLLMMAAGALAARVTCELLIVLFKIHENIHHLAKSGGAAQRAA